MVCIHLIGKSHYFRLIASTTVRSYLRGLFLLVADGIYHCIPIPYRKMSQRPFPCRVSQSRIGYMKLSLGLKKLVRSCMLQRGSRGSRNQSSVLELTGVPVTGGTAISWTSTFSSSPCIFHYLTVICTLDGSPSISKQTNHLNSWNSSDWNSSRLQD